MAQFAAAIAACNSESKFAKAYSKGVKKTEYWEVGCIELCSYKSVMSLGRLKSMVFNYVCTLYIHSSVIGRNTRALC